MTQLLSFFTILCLILSCQNSSKKVNQTKSTDAEAVPTINYAIKGYFPHDQSLFTEGFLFYNNQLFESSGAPAEHPETNSVAGISDLVSGKFTKKVELDKSQYFGEGITFFNNKMYQLTYKNQQGFIYDAQSFKLIKKFTYKNTEGWGLTSDSTQLIMSDGTDKLTFFDPETMKPFRTLNVTENSLSRNNLNELEFINGFIYANIWTEDIIVKIDPKTGKIVGKINLGSLVREVKSINPNADVLNGIAFNPITNKIYITGKLWSKIYEIDFFH